MSDHVDSRAEASTSNTASSLSASGSPRVQAQTYYEEGVEMRGTGEIPAYSDEAAFMAYAQDTDPVFAYYCSLHIAMKKAWKANDFALCAKLGLELVEDPLDVPVLCLAETHLMLSSISTVENPVEHAQEAVHQYRRLLAMHSETKSAPRMLKCAVRQLRSVQRKAGVPLHPRYTPEGEEEEESSSSGESVEGRPSTSA